MTLENFISIILADAETSPSEKVMLWTLVLSAVGGFLTSIVTLIKGQMDRTQARRDKEADARAAAADREQDRLDAELKARLIREEVAASARLAAAKGEERAQRIVKKIDENTDYNKQAIETANGHNMKIKAAVESVAEVAKVIATAPAKEIHVTVDHEK